MGILRPQEQLEFQSRQYDCSGQCVAVLTFRQMQPHARQPLLFTHLIASVPVHIVDTGRRVGYLRQK